MRKASQDGADATSVTSGIDNETKKSGAGIMKSKRNSIKRKVQNFSNESDDTVIEPLLQRDKEKVDNKNQSAKYILPKMKTDSINSMESDKERLLTDNKISKEVPHKKLLENTITSPVSKAAIIPTAAPIHNHINTNVFGSYEPSKCTDQSKADTLVKIEDSNQVSYSPSPLIFTTAKIHTDSKTQEAVNLPTFPIISTTEVSTIKSGAVAESGKTIQSADAFLSGIENNKSCKMLNPIDSKSTTTANVKNSTISTPRMLKTQSDVQENDIKISNVTTTNNITDNVQTSINNVSSDLKVACATQNVKDVVTTSSSSISNPIKKDISKSDSTKTTVKKATTTTTQPEGNKTESHKKHEDLKPKQDSEIDVNKTKQSNDVINLEVSRNIKMMKDEKELSKTQNNSTNKQSQSHTKAVVLEDSNNEIKLNTLKDNIISACSTNSVPIKISQSIPRDNSPTIPNILIKKVDKSIKMQAAVENKPSAVNTTPMCKTTVASTASLTNSTAPVVVSSKHSNAPVTGVKSTTATVPKSTSTSSKSSINSKKQPRTSNANLTATSKTANTEKPVTVKNTVAKTSLTKSIPQSQTVKSSTSNNSTTSKQTTTKNNSSVKSTGASNASTSSSGSELKLYGANMKTVNKTGEHSGDSNRKP